jgi:putative DNA primase/helicase
VVYVDGEMPARSLQERLAALIKAAEVEAADPDFFRLVPADIQGTGIPNLATFVGQLALEPIVSDAEVVFVDSISTLASSGRENEAESWLPIQAWALELRRRGKSLVFVHHDGKGGTQRGTSKKEDILDVTISLRHPADYSPSDGARFEVNIGKNRAFHGDDAKPFEAKLDVIEGRAVWTTRDLEDVQVSRAASLFMEEYSVRDVAKELGVSRSKAERLKKRASEKGLL